ncbi:serine/threonine-protein kinase Sgk2 [Xylaria cubensis]|nr:serine/threonine-protein kinase Sgk2 [Xylaria cubensis]
MHFTDDVWKILGKNPLTDALDKFRDNASHDDPSQKDIILNLLDALMYSEAASKLRYPGQVIVYLSIVGIRKLIYTDHTLNLALFHDLVDRVLGRSSDDVIWAETFRLISILCPSTPLSPRPRQLLPQKFLATPIKISSDRISDSILDEMKDCIFRDVGGFFDRFFPSGKSEQKMINKIMEEYDGKRWTDFPTDPNEDLVWKWLCALQKRHLKSAANRTSTSYQFEGRRCHLDFFLKKADRKKKAIDTSSFNYKDVLVVGTCNSGTFKPNLARLARYVRSIFADQPTRRYVHAFTLCHSFMELWVFDRSGSYSTGVFNIHKEPHKFARAFVGYATMGPELMGLDTFISRNGPRTIECEQIGNRRGNRVGRKVKFTLDKEIVKRNAIVCRGTTCYTTKDGYVVKFSWGSAKRKLEVDHLKLAAEKGVQGVAQLVAYHQVTTIEDIRKGLKFPPKPYKFNEKVSNPPLTSSKRKSKLEASHTSHPFKRRQTTRQKSKLANVVNNQQLISKNKTRPKENRIYSCLVIKPAGRVISDFQTPIELLRTLRDAIIAHRSLYLDGGILHRDISSNNIIITDKRKTGFYGMLIDLDLAKVRDSDASGVRQQTGTLQFMAIEVLLQQVDHTYRHDLESFFYVLIWMCARQSWNIPELCTGDMPVHKSMLEEWETGDLKRIATIKMGHMSVSLEDCFMEFPTTLQVKPITKLCLKIRKILFPLDEEYELQIGTAEGDEDKVYYQPIIEAYDVAIQGLEASQ